METSVLLAGSIYAAKAGIVQVKDEHFDRSMRLFGFLRHHSGIGLITKTVEDEATRKLTNAVTEHLVSSLPNELRSAVLNLCWDRLHDLHSCLTMVAVANSHRLAERLGDIVTMYGKLLGSARQTTRSRLRNEVGRRLAYVPPSLRGIASNI